MTANWIDIGRGHVWRPYTQMKTAAAPLPVARTEGVNIHLQNGDVLVDGIASWWTACHGYNHPVLLDAVRVQLERMPHVMFGGLAHEPAYVLAQRLAALLPGDLDHVFFAESGSVAVEIAMKMAVQYWLNKGVRGRSKFVCFRDGYHGDTFATMSVCDPDEGMHAHFSGVLMPQHVMALPRTQAELAAIEHLFAAHNEEIAGIIVEPLVQGAGGMVFHDAEVLARLRRVADAYGSLLIFDEIFTGFGRTGETFAMQEAGVLPDIVTLSKALTGGIAPLSAAIARAHVFDAFYKDDPEAALMHGPTYMAHALGCAAANASLDIFEQTPSKPRVSHIAHLLEEGLAPCRDFAGVADVRVKGAIGVVELERPPDRAELTRRFVDLGVWIRPFGKIVYLTPAFVIDDAALEKLTGAIRRVLSSR